jgi:glycosyltransferase involved in cell wall biosynthesis
VKKIAYLVSHPIQYQAPLLKYLAENLSADLEVLFISNMSVLGYQDIEFGREVKWDIPLLDGYKYRFLKTWGDKGTLSFWFPLCPSLFKVLKEGNYDYIWIHGWGSFNHLMALFFAKLLSIKILIRGESGMHLPKGGLVKRTIKFCLLKIIFCLVDKFLAIGTSNANFYLFFGVDRRKIFMMPYAINNDYFYGQSLFFKNEVSKNKNSHNIMDDSPIILYVSKLTKRKNILDLLDAYEKLLIKMPGNNVPYLMVIGDGELKNALLQMVRLKNLNRVHFLGFKNQSELPIYYEMCDVFVLPSSAEPWGLVVNEVMNHAKPVIVSDEVGCSSDLIFDGLNGYIFENHNTQDLADKLYKILASTQVKNSMGKESLEIISKWGFREDLVGLRLAIE